MNNIDLRRFSIPEKLLWSLGVMAPEDIDVEAIAFHLGATVRYKVLDGGDARIVGGNGRAIITVNTNTPKSRQRFSIGHEIGHWYSDRGRGGFLCSKEDIGPQNTADKSVEAGANTFASMLLLPDYIFKPRAASRPLTLDTSSELAGQFQTSLTATAIKLVKTSPSPSMVVCYSQTKREWFITSPTFSSEFWPHDDLHQDTDAFELLFSSGNGKTLAKRTSGTLWFKRRDASKFQASSQSMKLPDGTVLILISF